MSFRNVDTATFTFAAEMLTNLPIVLAVVDALWDALNDAFWDALADAAGPADREVVDSDNTKNWICIFQTHHITIITQSKVFIGFLSPPTSR